MAGQFYRSGNPSGNQYDKQSNFVRGNMDQSELSRNKRDRDEDLIIEENTVYEIDRECYERLKRVKKRKE